MKLALLTDDMTALPSDAEFDLVNRYAGGRMTAAEAEAFEKMLDDPAFFYRVAPLIKAWYGREPLPIEVEIGNRIEARRAAGLPLYEPSLVERVRDAATRIPRRTVTMVAAAAALAFAAVLRERHAAVAPLKADLHTALVSVDSPPPSVKQPTGKRPTPTSVVKSPTVIASAKPAVVVDTVAAQLPATPDTALERALSQLLGSPPAVQHGATTKADPVTVALNIPDVPIAKADASTSWGQFFKSALAIGPKLIGAVLSPIGDAIRGRTHKNRF